jgi:endoglucanase
MDKTTQRIVSDVLSLPTAPYHEDAVSAYIRAFAAQRGMPVKADRYGNLIVRYRRGARPKPVALTAHTDHPGFEVLDARGQDLTAGWLGACDPRHFPGGRVIVVSNGEQIPGRVTSPLSRPESGPRTFSLRAQRPLPQVEGAFGYWRLRPVAFDGDRIWTKAADNLAGCAAILAALDRLGRQGAEADLHGVFTRAEEVGLLGAAGLVETGLLPKRVPVVVLEASKALPGAEVGRGPIVRVGDRMSVFDPKVEYAVHALAQDLRKRDERFQFQRQLMSGGVCEATLYVLCGMAVGALAFPLGNYHNTGRRWPAEEYISASDMEGMVALCAAISLRPPSGETRGPIRKRFEALFKARRRRLLMAQK